MRFCCVWFSYRKICRPQNRNYSYTNTLATSWQINENRAKFQVFRFLRKEKWKAEFWKTTRNFTQSELNNIVEYDAEFQLAQSQFSHRKFSEPKSSGWIAETQNLRLNFIKKRIFPGFVFNDKNLENQRFELNIGKVKRSKKKRNEIRNFFEILRKKE